MKAHHLSIAISAAAIIVSLAAVLITHVTGQPAPAHVLIGPPLISHAPPSVPRADAPSADQTPPGVAPGTAVTDPVFVVIFWVRGDEAGRISIDSVELGGVTHAPDHCANMSIEQAVEPLKDAADKIASGLTPKIVCGMAAPSHHAQGDEPPKTNL